MLDAIRYWLAATDRGVSPATSLAILVVILLTLALSMAIFIFVGN